MRLPMLREIFHGIFNRPVFLAFNPSHAMVPSINTFSFSKTFYFYWRVLSRRSHWKPRLTVYRKSLEIFCSNGPTLDKKYKKGFRFSNISTKQGKMDAETTKIALNAPVHLRTVNQQMSRPERHVGDITDMRRSCRLRENTAWHFQSVCTWLVV